jgi:hypothetical protein
MADVDWLMTKQGEVHSPTLYGKVERYQRLANAKGNNCCNNNKIRKMLMKRLGSMLYKITEKQARSIKEAGTVKNRSREYLVKALMSSALRWSGLSIWSVEYRRSKL